MWESVSGLGPCRIIVSHVDDFLYGGNSYFLKTVILRLRSVRKKKTSSNTWDWQSARMDSELSCLFKATSLV